MIKTIKIVFVSYLLILISWWAVIFTQNKENTNLSYAFGAAYALTALSGSLIGFFYIAKGWGGFKSSIGKAIQFLSLGLFGLALGQLIWSYYNIVAKVEIPYPSLADFGYFSIVPFYGISMLLLAKVGGAKLMLKQSGNKVIAIAVPALLLVGCYSIYLKGIETDFSNPVKTFLDFGQPLGEAIVISIAIMTWQLSKKLLGGLMRPKIFFILFALIFQFITDFLFYYQNARGLYVNGGLVDLLYAISFTLMAIGLLNMSSSFFQAKKTETLPQEVV